MNLDKLHLPILAAMLLSAVVSQASVHQQSLNSNWKFRQARTVAWHDATVPGTVHTDLMANGLIRDPFVGQNEREVQWVDKEDWIYETTFDLDGLSASGHNLNLVFDGLDTYADVYLNDSLVLNADNMFRQWKAPVADIVRREGNTLRVYFHSPIRVALPEFEALPFQYDAGNDQSENGGIFDKRVSVFTRKAGYHYGWDWGPRLVTSGIWRPVYLEAWSGAKVDDLFIRTLAISKNKADMSAGIEVIADGDIDHCTLVVENQTDGKIVAKKEVSLQKGLNSLTVPFEVNKPRLWWSNGLGTPHLYDFGVVLTVGGDTIASKTATTGIRKIEVVREDDNDGRTFYFRLNGIPVFAKGANYIPCDNFLPRVTHDIYKRTVKDAVDANMNMLRIWGGGIYEDDYFYHLCDSLGIMVWQDFMFACSLYPSEGKLLENIKEEARYNVRRLRNHPSIVLWCGNNECLEGWYNWGWKRRYGKEGYADVIWKQYEALYHQALPDVVAECAPDMFYWPSSPFSRKDGAPEPDKGDSHMWKVWGGSQPIELYNQTRSRFFSEYGFQSFPEIETVLKYAPDVKEHYIESDVMLAHQRGGSGANRRIEKYLLDLYPQPKDFNSFLYMTQVLQGDAIRTAIEAHRRDRPYCMGSLFWQHNDCWPVASWSSRDYYGKWKAQHYYAKKAYRDILISTVADEDCIAVNVVSDRLTHASGLLSIETRKLDGTPVVNRNMKISVKGGSVKKIEFPKTEILQDADSTGTYVYVTLKVGDEVYENVYFPASQKQMAFAAPKLTLEVTGNHGNYTVKVTSDTFVRAFRMALPNDDGHFFADNYFDMLPGRTYSVNLKSSLPLDELRNSITWTSLYNATH